MLWYAPLGGTHAVTVPRELIPGRWRWCMARMAIPVSPTPRFSSNASTTGRLSKKDTCTYVLSCLCRKVKATVQHEIAKLRARLLESSEVLQMGLNDMKTVSSTRT